MQRFHALHYGLAAVLIFVGAKMCLADVFKIPTIAALVVVAGILIASVIVSLFRPPPHGWPPVVNRLILLMTLEFRRLSFSHGTDADCSMFCSTEINRWIARWENEGGAVLEESELRVNEHSKK